MMTLVGGQRHRLGRSPTVSHPRVAMKKPENISAMEDPMWSDKTAAVKRSPPNSCLIKPMDCIPKRQRAVGERGTLLLKGQHTNLLALSSSAGAVA